MNNSSLITQYSITADEYIGSYSLSENFYAKSISNDLFGFLKELVRGPWQIRTNPIKIRMNQGNIVIASNAITQGRQTLFNTLDYNLVRKRVT